jgi:hypothetical protein
MNNDARTRIRELAAASARKLQALVVGAEHADQARIDAANALNAAQAAVKDAEAAAEAEAAILGDLLDAAGIDRSNRVAMAHAVDWHFDDPPFTPEDQRRHRIINSLRRET